MKYEKAVDGLYSLMRAVQKGRSNALESILPGDATEDEKRIGEATLVSLSPWLFGEKNILIPIMRVVDRIEAGGRMEPMEWFNLCYVAFNLAPEIVMTWSFFQTNVDQFEPNIINISGWE